MPAVLHSHHPFRIFFISGTITLGSLIAVWYFLGTQAAFITLVLMLVEITFSFENAIINAKVLATVSRFWQQIFMTIGIFIAVFGMRLILPIVIVMLTSGLGLSAVLNIAINDSAAYEAALEKAHPAISSFGGMFLLMLCLHFFFDAGRKVRWIDIIEKPLQRLGAWWVYAFVSLVVLAVIVVLPINDHPRETLQAGMMGIITYLGIHGLAELFTRRQGGDTSKVLKTGMAGFMAFLYLEVLDASFSLDGVIGAFAVTKDVVLIAIGLGIGALWVRSLTLFMVRRRVLHAYRYLEHGAHYTIGVLAIVLLIGLFVNIPEVYAGVLGIAIVTASIVNSISAARADKAKHGHTA